MAMVFYYSMFALSLLLVVVYAFIFHKHFDHNLTILVVLVPIINFGFVVMGEAHLIEEALVGLKVTYTGGCFLLLSTVFLIFHTCGLPLKPWMRTVLIAVSVGVYATTLTIGHADIFYKGTPELAISNGAAYITGKHYGFMHTIFYVMVGVYYAVTLAAIIYTFFKRKQVPKSILLLILLAVTVAMLGFFGGRFITKDIEFLPATYNLGMIIYLIIASRLRLYDPSDSVIDTIIKNGDTGFASFDNRLRFLSTNDTAKVLLPELSNLKVDRPVQSSPWIEANLLPWMREFAIGTEQDSRLFEIGERFYRIILSHLKVGYFRRGYQFLITDVTPNEQYIRLIRDYNAKLEGEVAEKTAHIEEMQNKLVLGMATMVEGRDNSTGGHIKRTSDAIAILVEEIKKDNRLNLSPSFCLCLIKAAPMHDLGKIAVDDRILRKPGRFTPEEFEIMKTHASEGAKILSRILDGIDDRQFHDIAINVAHYHHERVDGSGYPKGLKGEEIPIEARIMAIADVYDALVSKRVYKERMSFEEADKIIMGSMGKHFDKSLEPYYVSARPKLEAYYKSLEEKGQGN